MVTLLSPAPSLSRGARPGLLPAEKGCNDIVVPPASFAEAPREPPHPGRPVGVTHGDARSVGSKGETPRIPRDGPRSGPRAKKKGRGAGAAGEVKEGNCGGRPEGGVTAGDGVGWGAARYTRRERGPLSRGEGGEGSALATDGGDDGRARGAPGGGRARAGAARRGDSDRPRGAGASA